MSERTDSSEKKAPAKFHHEYYFSSSERRYIAQHMDAAAYLKKQGWRGNGHSLDDSDRGIKKALQVSKKVDALGVGIQKYAAVSDQWWLRAYDQGLKELGSGRESTLAAAQKHGVNRGGLYARFTKGQILAGTIHVEDEEPKIKTVRNDASRMTTRSVKHVKRCIQGYVDEAVRRGILPPKHSEKGVTERKYTPADSDMRAVLKLAGLRQKRISATSSDKLDRKKMIRNLKRAAMKHMESQVMMANG